MRDVGMTNIRLTAVQAADFSVPITIAYGILAGRNLSFVAIKMTERTAPA
jgi:hypothetical protein